LAEVPAAERHHDRDQVGDRLMQRERLGRDSVQQAGRDAGEDGIAGLVADDIAREGGVHLMRRVPRIIEKEELQASCGDAQAGKLQFSGCNDIS
jgi:hypothetical protein